MRSRNSVNWWLVGLGILTRDWCEFVEYRFCLNHKFGFKYIDNFLVKAFSNWCIYSVYSLIISKIDPVLTNNGGYASSHLPRKPGFLFSVWLAPVVPPSVGRT